MSGHDSPGEEKPDPHHFHEKHAPAVEGEETLRFALQRTDDFEEPELHLRTILTIASLCFAAYAINIGVTSTGFWISAVQGSLGPSPISIFFSVGWLILQVGITPIFGLMSDFGAPTRKWICVGLFIPAIIGMVIAGSCDDWHVGIFGICLFGTAVCTYGQQAAIASDVVPRRMRGFVQGILYACQALGSITSAVAGGAFIRDDIGGPGNGWRWNLYLCAIVLGVAAFGIAVTYRPIKHPELHEKPYLQRLIALDWVGTILFSCGMVPFLLGLLWGDNKYPWNSAAPITSLALGGLFFILTAIHQTFIKKDGVFNHRLFKNRNFAISIVAIFVEGIVYITLNTFLGLQIAILYEQRPVYIGLHLATLLFCSSLSASVSGYYSHKCREMRYPLILGYIGFIGACVGFSQAGTGPNGDKIIYGMCALAGLAFGPPLALILAVAQLAVDPDLSGITSSLVIGLRSFGGVTGASIASAIFTGKISSALPDRIASAAIEAGVPAASIGPLIGFVADQTGTVPPPEGVTPDQIAAAVRGLRSAYAYSFSYIYYMIIPFCAVSVILLCFLRPTKNTMTWSITTPAESYDKLGVHRAVALERAESETEKVAA